MDDELKICPFCKKQIPVKSEKCPNCNMVLIERFQPKFNNSKNTTSDSTKEEPELQEDSILGHKQKLKSLFSVFISRSSKLVSYLITRKKIIFALLLLGLCYIVFTIINSINPQDKTIYKNEIITNSSKNSRISDVNKDNLDQLHPTTNLDSKTLPQFDISKPYSVDNESSTQKILTEKFYKNGKIFFRNNHSFNGLGKLHIQNGTENDAVAKLVNVNSNKSVLTIFIRRQSNLSISKIKNGNYRLYFVLGRSYDEEKNIFMENCSFSVFDEDFNYTTYTEKLTDKVKQNYTVFEVTLHSVVGGTARTNSVSKNEFLAL